jgi:hypothetical protein
MKYRLTEQVGVHGFELKLHPERREESVEEIMADVMMALDQRDVDLELNGYTLVIRVSGAVSMLPTRHSIVDTLREYDVRDIGEFCLANN